MSLLNPFSWGKDIAKRNASIEVPEKVFIEREFNPLPGGGDTWEYSEIEPAQFRGGYDIEDILYGAYGRQNFITLFYCLPEIFAPVNEIASRVAEATWQLCSIQNDSIDYKNKAFNRLFEKPNPLMTMKQFVWQSVCYDILTGANFQYLNKPSTLPDEIDSVLSWWNAPTQHVNIEKKKNVDIYSATSIDDFVQSIHVCEGNNKRIFDIKNVIPFIKFDLQQGNQIDKFKSDLKGAEIAIKNLLPVYEARGVIYVKRGALGFLVSKKSDMSGMVSLTPKEKEEAQKIYQQTYGLSRGKNQVGVTAAPLEYVSTSMSIQELQPFEETLADANVIYKTLRVPKHFVPSKDNSTFNNAESDTRAFYDDVILPYANKYAQAWSEKFAIPNRYIKADFSHIAVLKSNKKDDASVNKMNGTTWLERWQNGVCTLNEWISSFDGEKGSGDIYEKKIFELSPENVLLVKNIINLKSNGITSENKGTETQSSTDQLQ